MSTYSETETLRQIDITKGLRLLWNSFRRIWYVFLFLPMIFGGANFVRVFTTYQPVYTAEATLSVLVAGDSSSSNNTRMASQLGKVFPYILTSSALNDIIAADLGMSYVPGNITVTNLDGTNFLTIRVRGSDPELAYQVLQSVIVNYPEVAQHVVGRTKMELIDDSGIPVSTGKGQALRRALITGGAVGLLLAMLVLVINTVAFRTILTSDDLKSITNVTYLGTLPEYKKKKRRHSESDSINILKSGTRRDFLEAIRIIRTRLGRLIKKPGTVVMVTSSLPGEGKSTIAANLAISFGMQKKKVVIVDCDLRNPSLQQVLSFNGEYPGLAKYLRGECTLKETLAFYDNSGLRLYVVPGSQQETEEQPELLRTGRMQQMIEALRKEADIVILDTPPSAMLADAEMVTSYADMAIYVVLCDYASRSYVQRGIKELAETGITMGGVILNGGKEGSSGGYNSYGGYGKGSYFQGGGDYR